MRGAVALLALALLLVGSPVGAYEQRSGTFSFGAQAQIGSLIGTTDELDPFKWRGNLLNGERVRGPDLGLAVRLRLAIDRQSAVGVNFEAVTFDRSIPDTTGTQGEALADEYHATIFGVDYYRYFRRRAKRSIYAVGGIGFYRPELRFGELETSFPGTKPYVYLGVGGEHFFTRSVSLDLSLRFITFVQDGGLSESAAFAAGVRFYQLGRRRR